jgi:hypothetical protein
MDCVLRLNSCYQARSRGEGSQQSSHDMGMSTKLLSIADLAVVDGIDVTRLGSSRALTRAARVSMCGGDDTTPDAKCSVHQ